METPLLQTKLYVPQPQPNHIPRPHLVEQINEGARRKLTLVVAPAGFGKTSLLAQWITQSDRIISWLSMDDDDNEISRFLSYFIMALQKIDGQIGIEPLAVLQASQTPQINTLLTMLVNQISEIEENFCLILDDYHVVTTPAIHESLNFLLDHSPPNMHLIIASRADPFLPIPRYRARGELMELRMEDLRFTQEEAAKYLNQVTKFDLSEEDILALDSRTEGWISGIHLAALSMQGHQAPSQFISDLAGDDRYIIDYLVDEVLAQRPRGTRDFLIKTSILERMNADLCDAVTGASDGREMLSSLEQANLFIVPLDNRRHWYRYHRLFADLLHRLVEETLSRHEIAALHQLASQWFEEKGLVFEAIEHSLVAKDYESAIRLIDQNVEMIFATGQLVPLTRFWNKLPQEHLLIHPEVCMIFSWAWLATGYAQKADDCLRIVERAIGAKVKDLTAEDESEAKLSSEALGALVEVAVIQSQLAFHSGKIAETLELSQLALQLLEDEERPHLYTSPAESRCVAHFNLGLGHEFIGELEAADRELQDALDLAREVGNIHIVSVASGHLAKIHRINGNLPRAIEVCKQGIKDLQEMVGRSPMSGVLLSQWGIIEYEHNNLEIARERFLEAIRLAKLWGLWEALLPAYFGLARIRYALGDVDGAFRVLDDLEALGGDNPERYLPVANSSRAMFWALEGNLTPALEWVRSLGLNIDRDIDFSQEDVALIQAQILIAAKRFHEADRLIDQLVTTVEAGNRIGRLIELHVLKATSLNDREMEEAALEALGRALDLGEPSGYVRLFLDGGSSMKVLLGKVLSQDIAPDYVTSLLKAFETRGAEEATSFTVTPTLPLAESLSDRELDVLRLLKTELSGPEIAQELSIALSTMRTHTQSIYNKLGVSNRRAAVGRADELNLD